MKKYNFKETYLTESFFDDIDDDINNDIDNKYLNNINNLLNPTNILSKQLEKVTNKSNITVKYNADCNSGVYIQTFEEIEVANIDEFCKFINMLKMFKINKFKCYKLWVNLNDKQSYLIDFLNITVNVINSVLMKNIILKNITIEYSHVIELECCNFKYSDTINLYGVILNLKYNTNIKDYSFIKTVYEKLYLYADNISKFIDFKGLPNNKYELYIDYTDGNTLCKYLNTMSFTGIPSQVEQIYCIFYSKSPDILLNDYISLKGITKKLLDKIKINIEDFSTYNYKIKYGPYTDIIQQFRWSIPKELLEYMITNKIYNISCEKIN